MVDTLKELSRLSITLNSKSDQINQIISGFEEKLVILNLGIECWLDSPRHRLSSSTYKDRNETKYRDDVVLGFCRIGDHWRLAFKKVTSSILWSDDDRDWYDELEEESNPSPLLKASRELRVEALREMDNLFGGIKKEAEAFI